MSDEPLRTMLAEAVAHLRAATDLTMDEIIGLRTLVETTRTPEARYWLGVLDGAAAARSATRREMLEDFDLLTAAKGH